MDKEEYITKIFKSVIVNASRKYSDEEKLIILDNWQMILSELSKEQLDNGWHKSLNQSQGFETMNVGAFKELCLSGLGSKSFEDDAESAWRLVYDNLNSYCSPVFKDASIAESIRNMGGWKHICGMLMTDAPFRKAEFIKNYTVSRRSNIKFDPALIGTFKDDIKFIGDFSKEEKDQFLIENKNKEESGTKILGMMNKKLIESKKQ